MQFPHSHRLSRKWPANEDCPNTVAASRPKSEAPRGKVHMPTPKTAMRMLPVRAVRIPRSELNLLYEVTRVSGAHVSPALGEQIGQGLGDGLLVGFSRFGEFRKVWLVGFARLGQ